MSLGSDVLSARVAFRDRSVLDVLDLSLRFLVVHARAFAKAAAVVLAPALALSLVAAKLGGWAIGWLTALVLGSLAVAPFTVLASRLVFDTDVRVRDALRATARDLLRLVALRIVLFLVVGASFAFFFVPVFWASAAFFYVDEVLLLERAGIIGALARSQRVASASIGDALLGVMGVAAAIVLAIVFADVGGRMLVSDLLQFRAPPSLFAEGGSVLAFAGWFAVLPYAATARLFTYLNARTRAEGWDIQTRFASIAARAAATAATAGSEVRT